MNDLSRSRGRDRERDKGGDERQHMDHDRVKRHSHDDEDDNRHRYSSSRDDRRHRDRKDHKESRKIKDRADDSYAQGRKIEDGYREGERSSSHQGKEKDRDLRSHRDSAERAKRSYEGRDGGERDRDSRPHKRREREDGDDRKEKRHRVAAAEDDGDDAKARDRGEKRKFQENDSKTKDDNDEYRKEKKHASGREGRGEEHYGDSKQNIVGPDNGSASTSFNGVQQGVTVLASKESSRDLPKPIAISEFSTDTKVSTVFTTNVVENKADNIARSHEVIGNTSTDGTAATSKGGNLSLDALAKAKKALQIQKELSEKLKKLPQLNKSTGTSSVASSSAALALAGESASLKALAQAPTSSSVPSAMTTLATVQSKVSASVASMSAIPASAGNINFAPGMTGVAGLMPGHANIPNYEAVKRAQELAARMGFHQDPESMPFLNMFPGQMSDEFGTAGQQKPAKAPVLRLDAQGREIDEHGNVIDKPKITNLSTLKVNINKQKKEAFQILRPELDEIPATNPHFDARMGIDKTKLVRPKRMTFQFVEEGKWSKQAEILKFKSQFGEAQAKELKIKQAQLAKAKAELDINPNLIEVSERFPTKEEKPKDPIPDVEWWDTVLLPSSSYTDVTEGELKVKMEKLTIYVEHPQPIEPPAEPPPPPPQPLKLTKREQKKLRTQRRLAKEKDRQEMIRQGLIEPPKPKVKMSNLMKVLGAEATQDPTKLEMEIRSAAAEREQAHVDRNIARKLTPAERCEKKERKLFDDPNTLETIVSVYKITDLSHPQTRFKVDVNAQENRLSGCAVISDNMSVVVVEGGSKSIKRYGKLMLHRINWAAAVVKEEDEDEDDGRPVNKCQLVWQGSVAKQSFNRFVIQQCRTEAAARKFFADSGVVHYWDLAVNFSEDQIS
ncbi:protein RDM16 [Cryptomeria japonica]|uniref:protein RDM16 n=1 Tax=Cryptomeria japonica TaxID=3369 RepID=UPI0027DA0532|nr:protein RDM16 [Cryptomeria japonica]